MINRGGLRGLFLVASLLPGTTKSRIFNAKAQREYHVKTIILFAPLFAFLSIFALIFKLGSNLFQLHNHPTDKTRVDIFKADRAELFFPDIQTVGRKVTATIHQ